MHLWGNWGSCSPSWVSPLIFHPRDNQPHCLRTLRVFTSGLSHSEYPLGTPQVTRGKGGSITPSYCRLVILTHWCLMGVWFRSDLFIGGSLYRPRIIWGISLPSLSHLYCLTFLQHCQVLFFGGEWVLVQSCPDSNWCTDPDPKSLSHLTYTLSHIWIELSSLFFRFSQRLLRGIHRDTLINLDILSIPPRNANVKSFLHFFW